MTKTWDDLVDVENQKTQPKSLLLIDGNNLAYRWLQRKNYNSFQDDYLRTIESLSKSYNAERTIVCFDFGKSYYRMELLDTYKGNRTKPQEEEEQKHSMGTVLCFAYALPYVFSDLMADLQSA
jgi:5'-3' exonuclease